MANMSNYEQEHASFRLAVPELFNFGFDVVDRWAEDPSKLAMLWVDDAGQRARYTFADMRRESNRFASVLQGLGVRQGDGVMLVLPRLPQWHSIVVAVMKPIRKDHFCHWTKCPCTLKLGPSGCVISSRLRS